jgi:hypothetical protein
MLVIAGRSSKPLPTRRVVGSLDGSTLAPSSQVAHHSFVVFLRLLGGCKVLLTLPRIRVRRTSQNAQNANFAYTEF